MELFFCGGGIGGRPTNKCSRGMVVEERRAWERCDGYEGVRKRSKTEKPMQQVQHIFTGNEVGKDFRSFINSMPSPNTKVVAGSSIYTTAPHHITITASLYVCKQLPALA